jgi:pyruvate/2-oxoglutarate dehydrogenase complex dihydrolipoamide dehydrogenase (E3) component
MNTHTDTTSAEHSLTREHISGAPQLFDTVVIGAGQAGPGLASTLAARGERVALVEMDRFGGTCLNSGCRPTKALRASARAAHVARTATALGVDVGEVRVDLARVVARKDALIDGWRSNNDDYFSQHEGIAYLHGTARFTGSAGSNHLLAVTGGDVAHSLAAPRVIINTGARSVPPDIEGLSSVPWLDHRSLLDLTDLPDHLIVIGGSYIGLEFGQIFHRFGSDVTVLEHGPSIVAREDPDIVESLEAILRNEGVTIAAPVTIERVIGDGRGVVVEFAEPVAGIGTRIVGSHLLIAAGRVPNSDDLGLGTVGVKVDQRGYITTDDTFATNVPGIFAVGDVNGRGAFTHTAYQDSEILADHLIGGQRSARGRITTYALFTDPPLGRVGMSESEARRTNRNVRVASYPMSSVSRAILDHETDGLVRLVIDDDADRLLGAAILGIHGDELIHVLSMMMHADVPASALDTWLPVHPTVGEFLPTVFHYRTAAED